MYNIDELEKEAERLQKHGTPYLGKVLYKGKRHKVVVLPFLLCRKTCGLAYLVRDINPMKPAWSWEQKSPLLFFISNVETGESEDLQDYIDNILPRKIEHWEGRKKIFCKRY